MYRQAAFVDCGQVYHLICQMENRELPYDKFCEIYKKQLSSESHYFLVCDNGSEVVGVLHLRFEEQLHHAATVAEIMEFAVAPHFRKQGIEKEMLAKACELAETFGCIQMEVACNQLRSDTHRFLSARGDAQFPFQIFKIFNRQ